MERVFLAENPLQTEVGSPGKGWLGSGLLVACLVQVWDVIRQLRSPLGRHALSKELAAALRGVASAPFVMRALLQRDCSPWHWVEHWSSKYPEQRAVVDERGETTWSELRERAQALAAWLPTQGVTRHASVVVFCHNSRFLVVALLAIQRVGGDAVLLNASFDAHLLAGAIKQTNATCVLVDDADEKRRVEHHTEVPVFAAEDVQLVSYPASLTRATMRPNDTFATLFTSGTTAAPTAYRVTNWRAVTSGLGMGKLCLGLGAHDSIYCVLPLAHATGLLTGLCAALMTGSCIIVSRRFSATEFWSTVSTHRATTIIYVGEVVRRLLAAPRDPREREHCVKCAYGTAMPRELWHRFQARFSVPRIVEFYGATELPLALVNLAGVPGYVGRIALPYLSPWRIRQRDESAPAGVTRECAQREPGNLVLFGKLNTGDVAVRDTFGYVRLIGRHTDQFRQNGFNVSAAQTRAALRSVPGLIDLGVTHLALPHYDGQAGLVVAVIDADFSFEQLELAYARLPEFARPRLLRLTSVLKLNRGLKFDAAHYRSAGVDPGLVDDARYVYGRSGFVRLDPDIWQQLQLGTLQF